MILIALSIFINNDIVKIIIAATAFLLCPKNSAKTLHTLSTFLSHDRKKRTANPFPSYRWRKKSRVVFWKVAQLRDHSRLDLNSNLFDSQTLNLWTWSHTSHCICHHTDTKAELHFLQHFLNIHTRVLAVLYQMSSPMSSQVCSYAMQIGSLPGNSALSPSTLQDWEKHVLSSLSKFGILQSFLLPRFSVIFTSMKRPMWYCHPKECKRCKTT